MSQRAYLLFLVAALSGCGQSSGSGDTGSGGGSQTGGANGSGGSTGSGGVVLTGSGGNGSGGSAVTGSGGGNSSGGAPGSGGTIASGGATGAGGTTGTGGATAQGGSSGATGTGGAKGGATGTGGAAGATASGGATGAGGARGGATGAGGAKGGATGTGGGAAGSTGTGGSGNKLPSYFFGADVTDQEPAGTTAINNLLTAMKANGMNFVRLRTFVDPKASDGYDRTNGYDDIAHTAAFGALVKAAGMGLLVDFHMSDNWADPGKQCMPVAWQGYTTIADLSTALHDYVKSSITTLIAANARPDMVQIGNETTPGMCLHICDSGGQPINGMTPKVTGSTSNWTNLGSLLKAGIQGVKDVDTGILISFHIDKGGTGGYSATKYWIDNAVAQGATPDAFGESCYQQYQGDTMSISNSQNDFQTTFSQLASNYPHIRFFAAEYGPMERQINDIVFGLPNNQGLGTFDWEPTTQGSWNNAQPSDSSQTTHALWQRSGNNYTALPDLALYPPMQTAYASRL